MRPVQHGSAAELPAVVRANDLWQAALESNPVQNPGKRFATNGAFSHNGH